VSADIGNIPELNGMQQWCINFSHHSLGHIFLWLSVPRYIKKDQMRNIKNNKEENILNLNNRILKS
jgi:hypothetical protein